MILVPTVIHQVGLDASGEGVANDLRVIFNLVSSMILAKLNLRKTLEACSRNLVYIEPSQNTILGF